MENEEQLISKDYFKTSYNKEDITKLPAFKQWKKERENEGEKIVRCPICWGYEVFIEPTNHRCPMCNGLYCQYCLHPCVEDEVEHDHERTCCNKFCSLVELMIGEGKTGGRKPPCNKLLKVSLIFIFGNPFMFTYRYFKFFEKNKIINNDCVHGFFKYMNLFANILTCCSTLYLTYLEFFLLIFLPSIFPCYFYFIYFNWDFAIDELEVDETPLLEITVRGRGYDLY